MSESVVRDLSDECRQVGEQRGRALESLASDRHVSTAPVDLDAPTVDLGDAPLRQGGQTPNVDAPARRRQFDVRPWQAGKQVCRPRREAIVADAVIDVYAGDAVVTVEHEPQTIAYIARGRRGGERRPGARIRDAGRVTRDSDGAFGNVPYPPGTVSEGGREHGRRVVTVPSTVRRDTTGAGTELRVTALPRTESDATAFASASVDHAQILPRSGNGCKLDSRDKGQDVKAKDAQRHRTLCDSRKRPSVAPAQRQEGVDPLPHRARHRGA